MASEDRNDSDRFDSERPGELLEIANHAKHVLKSYKQTSTYMNRCFSPNSELRYELDSIADQLLSERTVARYAHYSGSEFSGSLLKIRSALLDSAHKAHVSDTPYQLFNGIGERTDDGFRVGFEFTEEFLAHDPEGAGKLREVVETSKIGHFADDRPNLFITDEIELEQLRSLSDRPLER